MIRSGSRVWGSLQTETCICLGERGHGVLRDHITEMGSLCHAHKQGVVAVQVLPCQHSRPRRPAHRRGSAFLLTSLGFESLSAVFVSTAGHHVPAPPLLAASSQNASSMPLLISVLFCFLHLLQILACQHSRARGPTHRGGSAFLLTSSIAESCLRSFCVNCRSSRATTPVLSGQITTWVQHASHNFGSVLFL